MEKKYEINENLVNEVLAHLQNRPFIEVHALINKVLNIKEIKENATKEE